MSLPSLEEASRKQRTVEKAKRATLKYTVILLAISVALIIGGYTRIPGRLGSFTVALGLALGVSSPLIAFYMVYRLIIKPWIKEHLEGKTGTERTSGSEGT